MVTAYKGCGFRIVIFTDDHPPAHVHVFGDGQCKIDLLGPDGEPKLIWSFRASKVEVRRAMTVVSQQRDALLERWESIHGRIDRHAA